MSNNSIDIDAARKKLLDHVSKGECLLFLGAGIHAPPPNLSEFVYPEAKRPKLGKELVKVLAEKCQYHEQFPDESPYDLQRVSLCFETSMGHDRKSLVDTLEEHLMINKVPSPVMEMLAELPFSIIATTNYDHLLETALIQKGKQPIVRVYNPNFHVPTEDMAGLPGPDRPMVFKMHGDLNYRESVVITDEDYITFVQRMSDRGVYHPLPNTVQFNMMKWPTLFVGYSLRDYNLRLLFRTLRQGIDKANFPKSFSIDRYPDKLIVKVWQDELKYITFLTENIWQFVPWLYENVNGKAFES